LLRIPFGDITVQQVLWKETVKGQLASGSHPLFKGDISNKFPYIQSLEYFIFLIVNIPEKGIFTDTNLWEIRLVHLNPFFSDEIPYISFPKHI